MPSLQVSPLRQGLPYGARVRGVNSESLKDPVIRRQLVDIFEDRGLIVFEEVEPSSELQLALSAVYGPLKPHPVAQVAKVDENAMPGVISLGYDPKGGAAIELDGKQVASYLPWHYDHCYNDELNRAGILRAIEIVPEGGETTFADGVDMYNKLDPALRRAIEGRNVVYHLNWDLDTLRFGRPKGFRVLPRQTIDPMRTGPDKAFARAIHPAVWTRATGEKVLHISCWYAEGLEGAENPEGDALLAAVCDDMIAKAATYGHKWKPTDMLIWDNWRFMHSVTPSDPKFPRSMHRTTIKGDYGLGRFEGNAKGDAVQAEFSA